jgi:hypothetical protein
MSRPHRAFSIAAFLVAAVAAGCGNRGPEREPPEPGLDGAVGSDAVLVRGRITPDTLVLEPVMLVPAGARGDAPDAGPHRLRGLDDHGQPLFDLRFAGAEVADLPRGPEEHFQLVVPVGDGGALTLARLELLTGDGRETVRKARLSASAMRTAMMDDRVVTARALDEQHVRIRWDPALFPLVIIRDGETGHVLAFGTGGETTVTAAGPTIGIVASEGVRSAGRTLRVR